MSILYGAVGLHNEQLNDVLEALALGASRFPNVKDQNVKEGLAGFGLQMDYSTPESLFESGPQLSSAPAMLFVGEGRLDNRASLAKELGIDLTSQMPDSELMRGAFLKWGKGSPRRLRGDWSFAVYDYQEQELFLARDHHGYTAIFYYFDGKRLFFSGSPKGIFALPGFVKRVNMRYFLEGLLIWRSGEKQQQAYEGLLNVPPAHTLSLKAGNIQLERYWFPENITPRHYRNRSRYAEELRELFREAVNVRLRSQLPVASMLSGGLDSGSVAVVAAALLRNDEKSLTTYSHVPLYTGKLGDEQRRYPNRLLDETVNIKAAAQHAGNIQPIFIRSENLSPVEGILQALDVLDTPFHAACNAFWLMDLPRQAVNGGFGSLLSGEMGNATISFVGVPYLLPWYRPEYLKNPLRMAKRMAKPLLLRYFPRYLERRNSGLLRYVLDNYVHQHVLDAFGILTDIQQGRCRSNRYYPDAKAGMLHILDVGGNMRCQIGHQLSNAFGIELRDPTGDVDVIEYCLSIPNEVFFGSAQENNKQVLRHMMQGMLPDETLFSRRKGLQASDILYRVLADKARVEAVLAEVSGSREVNAVIDTHKLREDWKLIQRGQPRGIFGVQMFLKGIMYGCFLGGIN